MNRRIIALTVTTAAVFGLAACSSAPAADTDEKKGTDTSTSSPSTGSDSDAAPADQSVNEACEDVQKAIADAGSQFQSLDFEAAMADPQATVDQFKTAADGIGQAVSAAGNDEVRAAGEAVHSGYVKLADILQKALIEQDTSVMADLSSVQTELTESAQNFAEVCTAG
ncbi:hypothetical protein GCM10025768_21260 [Microbacterium pseudoresistens]|uniref:Uncharacterized protein n=1 Tax=Microbacterium pseudoresistens TaxID=640634 RepID=A0A7Y9JMD8_9MICO|nr:hypothetical protein [Microbacterium pseudoresistens]NYD53423.1 hypothetical protein [Microbacterium pseudoresistens]